MSWAGASRRGFHWQPAEACGISEHPTPPQSLPHAAEEGGRFAHPTGSWSEDQPWHEGGGEHGGMPSRRSHRLAHDDPRRADGDAPWADLRPREAGTGS